MRIVKLDKQYYEVEDYKSVIRPFINCIDNITFSKKDDIKIQKAFSRRLIVVTDSIKKNGMFEAATCLFDRVFDAQEGNEHAIAMLKFIDICINNINDKIDNQLQGKFKEILLQLFINFDNKTSQYVERIGEIAVLDRILLSGNLILKDIEYRLNNGKRVDFVVARSETPDESIFLEVFNMHVDMTRVKGVNDLQKYFEGRFIEKVNIKLQGLDKDILKEFALVPVLWGDLDNFMGYADIFNWFHQYKPMLSSPFGIFYCHMKKGEKVYACETIKNIYDKKQKLLDDTAFRIK